MRPGNLNVRRLLQYFARAPALRHPAISQSQHLIGELEAFFQVVRGQQNGDLEIAHVVHQLIKFHTSSRRPSVERLVLTATREEQISARATEQRTFSLLETSRGRREAVSVS